MRVGKEGLNLQIWDVIPLFKKTKGKKTKQKQTIYIFALGNSKWIELHCIDDIINNIGSMHLFPLTTVYVIVLMRSFFLEYMYSFRPF